LNRERTRLTALVRKNNHHKHHKHDVPATTINAYYDLPLANGCSLLNRRDRRASVIDRSATSLQTASKDDEEAARFDENAARHR
jgi:hypothetical protein